MSNFLRNIRQQPEANKIKIINFLLLVFALILIIIWGVVLKYRFTNTEVRQDLIEDAKPFNQLTDNLSDSFNNLEAQ